MGTTTVLTLAQRAASLLAGMGQRAASLLAGSDWLGLAARTASGLAVTLRDLRNALAGAHGVLTLLRLKCLFVTNKHRGLRPAASTADEKPL